MANDYFQDITPSSDDSHARRVHPKATHHSHADQGEEDDAPKEVPIRIDGTGQPPRGIRSIPSSRAARGRVVSDMRHPTPHTHAGEGPSLGAARHHRGPSSRRWIWGAAIVGLLILGGLGLFAFRATTVTVTPRSHTTVLTSATSFIAYPAASAPSGALTYTLQTTDLEDSAVVPATGSTNSPASKASGSITVYNSYSSAPVKLVKNTRFQTPDGLVFRAPADVVVPAMKGTTAGSVQVTIVADQTGSQYNAGPVSKFTLPGLKSNATAYAGVYAKSTSAMSGGSSGTSGPGVSASALSAAVTELQDSLLTKARDTAAAQAGADGIVLPELIQITYSTQPNTAEAGGGARVHESAHVQIPVFKNSDLGGVVGSAVSADSDNSIVSIVPGTDFVAHVPGSAPDLSAGPLQFTLTGTANLIWVVDTSALTQALAGRDQGAFQTVISGFSGIEEAHAKIEPFWKSSFPTNPNAIKVVLTDPKPAQ